MATDKKFDLEVMSVDNDGNIACDGSVTATGGIVGDVTGDVTGNISQPSGTELVVTGGSGVSIQTSDTNAPILLYSDITITLRSDTGAYILEGVPTSDPVNAGQLWSDSGTLKISAGA